MGMLNKSLGAIAVMAMEFSLGQAAWALERTPTAVVELFTSQGCATCPPADAELQKLKEEGNVLTISLPVSYWDYIGWKDTLARPENGERQKTYAKWRGDREVYTPQMVINGSSYVVGNDDEKVRQALKKAKPLTAQVSVVRDGDAVDVHVDGKPLPKGASATVYLVELTNEVTVPIGAGENSGKTVTYVNVVHQLHPIGMWQGGKQTYRLPRFALLEKKGKHTAVLVQLENDIGPGPILGAGEL